MAWTGTAVFETITEGLVRITGLSLALSAAGTISLAGGGGDEELPADFNPTPYADVDLAEALQVNITKAATSAAPLDLIIEKTTAPLITVTNEDGTNATGALEIYVRYH